MPHFYLPTEVARFVRMGARAKELGLKAMDCPKDVERVLQKEWLRGYCHAHLLNSVNHVSLVVTGPRQEP